MSVASDGILVSPAAPVISLLSSGSMSSVAPTVTADQGTSGAAAAAAAAAAGPHLLQRFFPLAAGTSAAVVEVTPTLGVEMCLDTTFSRFVAHADSKIEVVLHHQLTDREIDLHRYLRTSVDAEFDRTLTTLGALAKHAPGLAVNTLMAWRDGAGDLPDVVPSHSLAAVNTGGSVSGGIASIRGSIRGGPLKGSPGDPARDLRLITSNILFCRALIEIIKNVPPAALKDELGLKCEELAFNQLRVSVPDLLRTSTNWLANATYFAQVLGELSATRFTSVSDRYLRELERLNAAGWLKDGKAEHIIFGMKFIQLKLYPMDALDDTADFLDSLGHFFLGAADTSIRQTFMETFVELLTPMCEIITAEVNVPTWVTFVESMFPKVQKMAVRPRHQSVAFSLLAALLSISRADFFSKHWMSVMDMAQTKLKDRDRTLRTEVLLVMVQLLWVYLFRHSEPTITAHKRIGMLVKLLFPPGRRSLHPPEVGTPLFTYVIYMIGVRFPSWCVANLIPPLLACESGNPESGWAPDRMTVAIDAVHWLISAWAGGAAGGDAKPSFPSLPLPASVTQFPSPLPELKPKHQQAFLASIAPLFARILEGLLALVGTPLLLDDERNRAIVPFKPPAASSANLYADLLGTVRSTGSGASGSEPSSAHATSLLIDRHHSESFGPGGPIPLTSMTNGSLSAATGALFNGGGGGNSSSEPPPACFVATVTPARMPFIELLKTLVSALPRIAPFYEQERLIDTLSSFTVHPERGVADAAVAALDRMAAAEPARVYQDILLSLESRVFAVTDRALELLTPHYVRASAEEASAATEQVHVGVLEVYADYFRRGHAFTRLLPLDGLGLYLLCSPSSAVRRLAIQILTNADSKVLSLLRETGLTTAVVAPPRTPGAEEWVAHFAEFIEYCVDFLPRESVKKAVQVALERTTILHNVLCPADTGILWTTAARSPPDESLVHWRRCAILVVLGLRYLSSPPREVLATYLQLLSSEFAGVRDAAQTALKHTLVTHQGMLFDEIVPSIQLVADDARMRVGKKFAMPKKPGKIDRLRIELPRLLTALDSAPASALSSILALLRALKAWLADQRANPDVDSIRAPFAQLLTAVYSRIVPSESLSPAMQAKFMELRGSLFVLVAEWEDTFPSTAADALAALLRGPVPARSPAATAVSQAFDRDRALKWINGMLSRSGHGNGGGSAMASTAAAANYGFKGLVHLLEGNPSSKNLYESIARKCFALPPREPLSRYYLCAFSVVFQGAIQHQDWSVTAIETVLLLGLIKLADEKHDVDTLAITASPLPLTVALPSSQLQAASSAVPMPPHSASTPGTEFPSPTLGPMRNRLDSGTTGAGGGGLVPSLFSCNASQSALDMLQCLQDRLFLDLDVAGVAPLIGLPIHSHSAAVVLVERMARNHPDWTLRLLSELFYRIEPSAHSVQDLLFNFAAVLVRNVVLLREDGTLSVDTRFVIENLLYLTMSLSDGHSAAIKQCWINLAAASEHNLRAVVAYSVQLAKKTRSDTAVSFLRVILTFVHDVDTTFVHLLPYLTPPMFIYFSPDPDGPLASTYYVPSLDTVIPTNPTRHQWSEGIIGTLFVSGIVRYLPADTIEQYLALFLEVAIAQLDHPDAFVASEMRAFLCTLFQFEFTSFARLHQFLDEVVASLPVALVDAWNAISLRWASNCTILHVAIKSLQMFRCSLRIVTQDMLRDLLRLYVTVAGSPTPTSAQFATEILTSIRAVLSHPTFHGSVDMVTQFLQIILQALVQPPEEHVDMLLQVLEIIIVADSRRVSLVDLGYIVPHVSVTGLFLAVLQRSNNRRACTLMNALLTISEPRLTWKPVAILLANLTDMAKLSPPQSAPSAGAPPTSSAAIDAVMSQLAIITGAPAGRPLGKYLSVWVKYRAKTADDLMHQLAVALRDPYLSQYADPILQTLLGFLSGPDRDVSVLTSYLQLLKHVLPLVHLADPQLAATYLTSLLELTRNAELAPLALQVMDTLLTLIPTISVAAKSHQAVLPSRTTTINKKTRAGSELVREWARLSAMDAAARASDTAASAAAAASAEKSSPTGSAGPSPGSGSGGRGNGSGGGKAGTSPQHGVDGGKPLYRLPTLPSASSSMSRDGEHQSHDALQPSNLELATSTASVASGPLMSSASSSSSPRDHSAVSRSATASARALPSAVPEEFPSLSRGTSAGSTAPLGQYHHQQLQHHHHQYAADEGSAMSMPTLSTDPLATAAGTPGDGSLGQVALLNGSAAMLDTMTSGASSPRGVGTAGSGGRRGATPSSSRVNSGPSPDVARRLSGQTWAPTSAYALYESGHHAPTRIPPTTPSTAAPLSPLVPLDQIPSASGESLIAGTVPGSELDLVSATPPTMLPMSMSSESLLFSAPLAASYHAAASAAFGGGGAGGSNGGLYSSPRTLGLAAGTSGTVSSRDRATSLNNLMLVGTGRVSLIPNAPAAVTITSALDDDDDDDDEDGHGKGTSFAQGSSSGQFNPTDDDAYDSDRSEVSMSSAHRSHSAGGGGGDEIDGDRSGPAVTTFGSTGSLDFMSQPVDFQQQEQHQDQALRQYKSTFSNGLHAAPLPPTSQLEGEDGGSLGSLLAAGSMTQLNGGAALSSFPLDSISSVETRGGSEALPLQLEIVPATTASLVSLTSVESLAGVDAESLEPAPPVHLGRRRG